MKTIALLTVITLLVPALHASTHTLEFTSLPSAQGWTPSGYAQSVYSVSEGVLTQDSIGIGYDPAYYQLDDFILSRVPFSISMRARVLEGELGFDALGFAVQVSFTSHQGDEVMGVGIGPDGVMVFGSGSTPLFSSTEVDTAQYHDYVLTGRPAGGHWELFVDGALVGSGITPLGGGIVSTRNIVYLGDLTDGSNARAELTRLVLISEPPPKLTIRKVEPAGVQLSWATNTFPYDLEYTADIPTSSWSPVTNAVTMVGSDNVVTTDADAPARFFRLRPR